MQPNATCVTGMCLAHALPRASVRVTTQRSAVVTRTYSGLKYAACQNFLNIRPTAPGIMVSLAKIFSTLGTTTTHDLSILATRNQFYPWPLRQSGNQGTFGSCNRCISESCDPSSTAGSAERSVHLRNQGIHRAVLFSRHPPVSNHEPRARRSPLAIVLPCSFSTDCRLVLLISKEVLITIIRTPVLGHVGLRWVTPVPGIPALPASRHF